MMTNNERALKKFMPAFRLRAAQIMVNEYGIGQQKAAEMLGTTQAAISKYMKESSDKYKDVKIDSALVKGFVERALKNDFNGAQRVICSMCQSYHSFDCALMVR
jgi:predicted transcriptional regulator